MKVKGNEAEDMAVTWDLALGIYWVNLRHARSVIYASVAIKNSKRQIKISLVQFNEFAK